MREARGRKKDVLKTASVGGDGTPGPVTSQTRAPMASQSMPSPTTQPPTTGPFVQNPSLLIPWTWVAGSAYGGRNVPAERLSAFPVGHSHSQPLHPSHRLAWPPSRASWNPGKARALQGPRLRDKAPEH